MTVKASMVPAPSGLTKPSRQALAERRRAHLAMVRWRNPTDELEAYKQEHGLRNYREATKEIGCGETALRGWLQDDLLPATVERYPGRWGGNPPVLFPEEAIQAGRELLAAAYRGRGERMAAKWIDGRITARPRQGILVTCPIDGNERYRVASQADRKCCCDRCAQLYRWHVSRKGLKRLIERSTWHGPSRKRWLGTLTLLEVAEEGRHAKGAAPARETLARALILVEERPALTLQTLIDTLVLHEEGRGAVYGDSGERRARTDPAFRAAKARVERRLRRGFRLEKPPELAHLLDARPTAHL